MPDFAEGLVSLGLKPSVIADIDLIRSESTLEKLIRALGRAPEPFLSKANRINNEIAQRSEPVSNASMRKKLDGIFLGVSNQNSPVSADTIKQIKSELSQLSPFATVKRVGRKAIPSGDCMVLYSELTRSLSQIGISGWFQRVSLRGSFGRAAERVASG
jgi:hypothetical protein